MNARVEWLGTLGASADPTLAAWDDYLSALRENAAQAWKGARDAYFTLKQVRADLGLPFMAAPGGEANKNEGAWAPDLEQNMVDLQAMAGLIDVVLGECVAGKRKLVWDPARKSWVVEGLPGDTLRLDVSGNQPVLIPIGAPSTASPVHVQGTVGIPPLVLGLGLVAGAAVVGAVLLATSAMENGRAIVESYTMKTISVKWADLVAQGKATPDQAKDAIKATYAGAADVRRAAAEEKKAASGDVTAWGDIIKVVALAGLGIGVLYVIGKAIPSGGIGRARPEPALAP